MAIATNSYIHTTTNVFDADDLGADFYRASIDQWETYFTKVYRLRGWSSPLRFMRDIYEQLDSARLYWEFLIGWYGDVQEMQAKRPIKAVLEARAKRRASGILLPHKRNSEYVRSLCF